jgi:hypothetical protein
MALVIRNMIIAIGLLKYQACGASVSEVAPYSRVEDSRIELLVPADPQIHHGYRLTCITRRSSPVLVHKSINLSLQLDRAQYGLCLIWPQDTGAYSSTDDSSSMGKDEEVCG